MRDHHGMRTRVLGAAGPGALALLACAGAAGVVEAAERQPNVVLIMTDDQGYGDVSAHGNPVLKTPEIDRLREASARFTDFHVAPMCTPTRGMLMTGMDAFRNGATLVCMGRSMMRNELKIMPQYFAEAGYATGMFGKWHLGDSYPHRPHDRFFYQRGGNLAAVRHGDWKLTTDGELFNLRDDIAESRNIAEEHPEKVALLKGMLDEFADEVARNSRPVGVAERPRTLVPRPGVEGEEGYRPTLSIRRQK